MSISKRIALMVAAYSLCVGWLADDVAGQVKSNAGGKADKVSPVQHIAQFKQAKPGSFLSRDNAGRIRCIYGKSFSSGDTPQASVQQFLDESSGMFGVPAADLLPIGRFADGRHLQPIMYDKATSTYKFTGVYYTQHRGGVRVFRGEVMGLVRNQPGNPLVLVSANLFNLGNFQVDQALAAADATAQVLAAAKERFGADAVVRQSGVVIWAGVDEQLAAPRLAHEAIIFSGFEQWRIIADAKSGEIVYEEDLICTVDIAGSASGLATSGIAADQCEPEIPYALPYLNVTTGVNSAVSDVDGNFVIPNGGTGPVTVSAGLDGLWFDVFDITGTNTTESQEVTPPGPANLLFNLANNDEHVRAQVNAYVGANVIRDFVLQYNPAYPTLDIGNFPVNVNRTDGFCPSNAWYSQGEASINFCLSSGGWPNTSFGSVIYHEYGHHLVEVAKFSGQGQYGEGMGDTMSVLLLDSPLLGVGFFGDCDVELRNADNSMQYPCAGEIHECGQLLSGCVWSTRNELLKTNPSDYLEILSNLTVNSILEHEGSLITPDITLHFLTLDDDDADLTNGTPHYAQIKAGFSAHNMPPPGPLDFIFPNGLTDIIQPAGGTTILVEIQPILGLPAPGSAMLHAEGDFGLIDIPMVEIETNVYEATFPALPCGDRVEYFITAQTLRGEEDQSPTFAAYVASEAILLLDDDFETDQGWTVTNSGGLTDGPWDRGVPVPYVPQDYRGAPDVDGDGSGQCYLTDNAEGDSDVDAGTTTLTSPIMDASSGIPVIKYWRWYSNDFGNAPFSDIFVIEVSDDGGTTWMNLETVGPDGIEVTGGWYLKDFVLTDVAGFEPSPQTRIQFVASDLGAGSVVEAAVDGVRLYAIQCVEVETCPADLGDDGDVGPADLADLLAAWGSNPGGPPDFDGSGSVGPEDLATLLAGWGACP